MFSWIIEADIHRLKKSVAEERDPASQRLLEEQLQQKEQQLSKVIASEYRSAFTN